MAYVQLRAGASATEADLLAFLKAEIAERAALPRQVNIIETMPLTAVGKKSFIAELMPRQPMYVDYLPQDAQELVRGGRNRGVGRADGRAEEQGERCEQGRLHFGRLGSCVALKLKSVPVTWVQVTREADIAHCG